jgi:ribonuclease D
MLKSELTLLPMQYELSISKEQINELPLFEFDGKVELIDTELKAQKVLKDLKKSKVLGFDTETRPAFKKGQSYSVSLLQLSTMTNVYLFRLNKFSMNQELAEIMSNENIKKVGVAVRDDIKGLQKIIPFEAKGFIDLATVAKERKIKNFGLRALTAIFLKKRLSKKAKISNWENPSLTPSQISYAACDAYAGLMIYTKMFS